MSLQKRGGNILQRRGQTPPKSFRWGSVLNVGRRFPVSNSRSYPWSYRRVRSSISLIILGFAVPRPFSLFRSRSVTSQPSGIKLSVPNQKSRITNVQDMILNEDRVSCDPYPLKDSFLKLVRWSYVTVPGSCMKSSLERALCSVGMWPCPRDALVFRRGPHYVSIFPPRALSWI